MTSLSSSIPSSPPSSTNQNLMKCLTIGIGAGENTEAPHDNQEEAHQFFLPFRGFCARKGVRDQSLFLLTTISYMYIYRALTSVYMFTQIIATEVLLHDIDISSAIVDYITHNSIANIVLGASARNSFLKSLSFSHITYNCKHNFQFHEH